MKPLLLMALALVFTIIVVVFLPLSASAMSVLVGMLGGNALLAISFALMANSIDK